VFAKSTDFVPAEAVRLSLAEVESEPFAKLEEAPG
jgi:hypothetical protein